MKLKVTPKFLLSLKDPAQRQMCSVRINKKLFDYVKYDADEKNMRLVEYVNNLFLVAAIAKNEGKDVFDCLSK